MVGCSRRTAGLRHNTPCGIWGAEQPREKSFSEHFDFLLPVSRVISNFATCTGIYSSTVDFMQL